MFWNYLKIALRNLRKNRLFATINIVGLAVGLTTFVFTSLIVNYEINHDSFFEDSEHIYTIGLTPKPTGDSNFKNVNVTNTAVGPILEAELADIDAVARVFPEPTTIKFGDDQYIKETVSFTDPGFTDVFRFNYIYGSKDSLNDPSAVMLTESMARILFGDIDVVGEQVTLDDRLDLTIAAVIEDIPANSHFHLGQNGFQTPQQIFTPMTGHVVLRRSDPMGDWKGIYWKNLTYVRLPEHLDQSWLQQQLEGIYQRHVPETSKRHFDTFSVRPIYVASLVTWDRLGIPVTTILPILGLLILFVACVNYTNLAVAQSLARSREIGMRKTMGASQGQLLAQFLFESLIVAVISMLICIAALELIIPLFNNSTGKILNLDYLSTLPWLFGSAILVGMLAGLYPCWLITRIETIDALNEKARKGKWGNTTRSIMIGAQFVISMFMLASVAVVFAQNKKMEQKGDIFAHEDIQLIYQVKAGQDNFDTDRLLRELQDAPVIHSAAYSSISPFMPSYGSWELMSEPGDEAGAVELLTLEMTPEFLRVYDIAVVAGRNLDSNIRQDIPIRDVSEIINVLINETAAARLGYAAPQNAIGETLYPRPDSIESVREYVIVGVVEDKSILGFNNALYPRVFSYASDPRMVSVRIHSGRSEEALEHLTDVWNRFSPTRPIVIDPLTSLFGREYAKFKLLSAVLTSVASIAVALSLVGLFGLTTLMSVQRTKEIGIRKVLGANSGQIMKLLITQISRPIIWALCIAVPALFFAAKIYLGYFPDPIKSWVLIIFAAAFGIVLIGWAIIIGQTYRVARANPIRALRYE